MVISSTVRFDSCLLITACNLLISTCNQQAPLLITGGAEDQTEGQDCKTAGGNMVARSRPLDPRSNNLVKRCHVPGGWRLVMNVLRFTHSRNGSFGAVITLSMVVMDYSNSA